MLSEPFYDPLRSYQDNFEHGPFGLFADPVRIPSSDQPKYNFLGHALSSPFGIPAGPLINGKYVKAALDAGFDAPVYKTVRTSRYPCHPWPNVLAVHVDGDLDTGRTLVADEHYTEPLSITNSFGVPSYDPEFWQPDLADAVKHAAPGQVVVGSYQGTKSEHGDVDAYIADFVTGARLLKETGVKIVEVNFSCPNEGTAALLCFDIPRARDIAVAIKNELGDVPLVTKIAYFGDDERLGQFVREVGSVVDGIAAINTVSANVVNEQGEQALPGEGRLSSGVCGSAIQWAGVEMVQRLARLRESMSLQYQIVGVGGVGDAAGFDRFRKAGADVVMSATGAMWNPSLAKEIQSQIGEPAYEL
jgi:dihydroorotate dehydrogenase (NAD+) catalytic subunit